jgi:altronate dehydratase
MILGIGLPGVMVGQRAAAVVKGSLVVHHVEGNEAVWLEAVRHPNVSGMVVVGEELDHEKVGAFVSDLEGTGKPRHLIELRGSDSIDAVSKTVRSAVELVRDVSTQRRELTRLSELSPALFQSRDSSLGAALKEFAHLVTEENGRCLWMGREGEGNSVWRSILRGGAQLVIHPVEEGRYGAHPLVPAINIVVGPPGDSLESFELDLCRLTKEELKPPEAAMLLLTETIATASGKSTRDEILENRILIL